MVRATERPAGVPPTPGASDLPDFAAGIGTEGGTVRGSDAAVRRSSRLVAARSASASIVPALVRSEPRKYSYTQPEQDDQDECGAGRADRGVFPGMSNPRTN